VDFEIPEQLDDATIQKLVAEYKETRSLVLRDQIIESHIRLAMGVVARFVGHNRRRKDDLISAALHGLTQAVEWAPDRLKDDNITPYIWATVMRFVRDFLSKDRVVTIERRAFKEMIESGGVYSAVPYLYRVEADDSDEENYLESEYVDQTPPVYDEPTTELEEMIQHLHKHDEMMVFIIDSLVKGHTLQEIGHELGYTKQYISKLVAEIRERVLLWERRNG